ncbi:GrpB family protein [Rhizobium sp. MC63]|uniref:GrpB family protein n=1 Tax=Rhizobium mulingense TaxID=3031128 RepID=A0ACC6MXA8_9HYPH|nr:MULTISPECIES: GrpB family protein [unclassified Rhizobium]MDF0698112.1 GrpB family protein [Rhizobium sp. MC63]MEA3518021.1 GrpB family protein [Rhizobium sp. MJ31]MEB3043479.1 GrpB family protein [Rhizobium sp. MJ21]
MPTRIEIEEPQQSWAEDFAALKRAIMLVAPAGAYLHHIGSTAIPGLPAKDIIDIQLTVNDLADVDVEAFEQVGFEHRPIVIDHCPPGVKLAEGELHKAFYRSRGRPANLHIRENGRFNQRYSLLCRDFLRAHGTAANAYALIKQRLAQRFPDDVDFYYDIKDPVFDIIMDGANEWARLIGWSEPPAD